MQYSAATCDLDKSLGVEFQLLFGMGTPKSQDMSRLKSLLCLGTSCPLLFGQKAAVESNMP